jgi:hypothetical protein
MATYPRHSDITDIAAVQEEEVAELYPLGADIHYRWARTINSLWEHLADAPIVPEETQSVSGHCHSRTEKDTGISEYVGRISAHSIIPAWVVRATVAISTTAAPTFSAVSYGIVTPYVFGTNGLAQPQTPFSGTVRKLLLTRDVKQYLSEDYYVTVGSADNVRIAIFIYDDPSKISGITDTIAEGFTDTAVDGVVSVTVDIPDDVEFDTFVWVVYWVSAWNVAGTGTAATVTPYYPARNHGLTTRQAGLSWCKGEP